MDHFDDYLQERRAMTREERREFWRGFLDAFCQLWLVVLIIAAVLFYAPELDAYFIALKVTHG